jgi:hypothetical protein
VVLNLLSNAVKFTAQGGVEVVLGCNGTSYSIEVNDTGIGMDPAKVESMFDPFSRPKPRSRGASAAPAWGWRSAGGWRARSVATSPAAASQAWARACSSPSPPARWKAWGCWTPPAGGPGQPRRRRSHACAWRIPSARVLVVDDGPENRELLSLVLSDHGLWWKEAENGQAPSTSWRPAASTWC